MFVAVVFVFLFSFFFRCCGGGSQPVECHWGVFFFASKALDGSLDHVEPQVVMSGQMGGRGQIHLRV